MHLLASRRLILLALLALLAVLPYLPVFVQPFVSDDYIQIALGRKYGPPAQWGNLLQDPLYRCRATSIVITFWTERLFGTSPLPFYSTSVLLHLLNTFLLFAVARRLRMGAAISYLASAFFAVYLGHQEAVMWYAALPELLLFFFCGCFLLSWNAYLQSPSRVSFALAFLSFTLALLSKEAAVVLVPAAAAMALGRRQSLWPVAPFALSAALYTTLIFQASDQHLHLNDGTFSLHAPFLLTWARSIIRMFWFWGFLALLAIAVWKRKALPALLPAAFWIAIALLPFCFLSYMTIVPSRHTYLASAGVGFFVAAGMLAARRRFPATPHLLPLLLTLLAVHHTGYIWLKKRGQYLERAAATEHLLHIARRHSGPIYITCFPYTRDVAEKAIEIELGHPSHRLVWSAAPPSGAVTLCAKDP
jgi:hypothetical protein